MAAKKRAAARKKQAVAKKRPSKTAAKVPGGSPEVVMQRATVLLEDGLGPDVAKHLRSAGFKVESNLESIGAVTGSVPAHKLQGLKTIKGVKSVEPEQTYQLPPPDSEVQ